MRTRYREPLDDEQGEIIAQIVRELEDDDILAIPGIREFVAKYYEDDIAERWQERLEAYAAEAQEARWRVAAE